MCFSNRLFNKEKLVKWTLFQFWNPLTAYEMVGTCLLVIKRHFFN